MKPLVKQIASIAMILTFGTFGCAAFRSNNLPPVDWPLTRDAVQPSISILVSGRSEINGKRQEVHAKFLDLWRRTAWGVYEDSGLFSQVQTGAQAADFQAEIRIREQGEVSYILAALTGLTFYIIPSVARSDITVETTFYDDGTELGVVTVTDGFSLWQQLFLVFLMPSNFPTGVAKSLFLDLHRATLVEARQRGFFNAGAAAGTLHP